MFDKFRKLDQLKEQELQQLGEKLTAVTADFSFAEAQKSRMKANLFEAIESGQTELPMELCNLSKKVSDVTQGEFLSNRQKHLMFSEVKEAIAGSVPQGLGLFGWMMRSWKAGLASVLIFVFSLSLFALAPVDLRLTRASKWTFLESVEGEVFVNRDGRILSVDKNFALEEGDLVFTKDDSFVTIRFLDDSVTRLGEDTSLEIKKLYAKPENSVSTQVELSLTGGQVWASVYNLVDNDSKFQIETENATAKVNSKAAFEMKTDSQSTKLAVYDNVVDFSKKTAKTTDVQSVISGYTAEVDNSNSFQIADANSQILLQKNTDQSDDWVMLNLGLDKEHIEALKKENSDFVDSAVASDDGALGALADFKDSTKALFNNTEIEQARQQFLQAEIGIIKAQQLIADAADDNDYRHQATPLMIQYKTTIQDVLARYESLKKDDQAQADQLIAKMQESVDLQRKYLSLVLPNEKLYTAKQVVNEASSYFVRNAADQAEYLLAKARNKLLEVEGQINKGDLKGADAGFRVYLKDLDDLVAQVNTAQVSQTEGGLFNLLDEQIKQLKVVSSIDKKLSDMKDTKFSKMVDSFNKESLDKLISIIKTYRKKGIPFAMLVDLNNTVQSYFAYSTDKLKALADLKAIMQDYPEFAEMNKPNVQDVNSTQDVIVDFNSTQDVGQNLDANSGTADEKNATSTEDMHGAADRPDSLSETVVDAVKGTVLNSAKK